MLHLATLLYNLDEGIVCNTVLNQIEKGDMDMKKLIAFFAVVILIGNLVGCSINNGNNSAENNTSKKPNSTINNKSNSNENKEPKTTTETIKDYYPMKKNTRYIYIYEGVGNEFAW